MNCVGMISIFKKVANLFTEIEMHVRFDVQITQLWVIWIHVFSTCFFVLLKDGVNHEEKTCCHTVVFGELYSNV